MISLFFCKHVLFVIDTILLQCFKSYDGAGHIATTQTSIRVNPD
jgi:hypothetical protein